MAQGSLLANQRSHGPFRSLSWRIVTALKPLTRELSTPYADEREQVRKVRIRRAMIRYTHADGEAA